MSIVVKDYYNGVAEGVKPGHVTGGALWCSPGPVEYEEGSIRKQRGLGRVNLVRVREKYTTPERYSVKKSQ